MEAQLTEMEPGKVVRLSEPQQQLSVVQYAVQSGAPVAEIKALLELQIQADNHALAMMRAQAEMARADRAEAAVLAYNEAFAAFKSEAVQIIRTKEITDGPLKGKKHAELGVIIDAVTPALSKHGLSTSWKLTKDEKDWLEVTCTLRHVRGHSECVSMGGGPDTGPGRNAIQARSSAISYLERITKLAALGLAAKDQDNDGAGATGTDITAFLVELGKLKTDKEALDFYNENKGQLAHDNAAAAEFKRAVVAHRMALKGEIK